LKPLDVVDEQNGPWSAPLAALNHLFPMHLRRAPLRWIPRAGAGETFADEARSTWRLWRALSAGDADAARAELARLDERRLNLLERPWWRGIGAFVAARAATLDDLDAVPDPLRPRLVAHGIAARQRYAAVAPAVVELAADMASAGIDCAVAKGLAHAAAWYPEPWSRPIGDVDLVVRATDEARARAELERRGAVETAVRGSSAFRGHHHGVPLKLVVAGHPLVCELHTRLGPDDPDGWCVERALAERGELATDCGPLPVLSSVARVAHAAMHHTAELDAKGLADLALAAHRSAGDWSAARAWLPPGARWRVDLAVGLAAHVGGCDELASVVPPARRGAIERGAVPHWGAAHAARMERAGGRPRPRHWLAGWRPAVDEVVRRPLVGAFVVRQAIGLGLWVERQARLASRLVGDGWTFVFPPSDRVTGSYAMNSARALKSLVVRALAPLRRRS